MFIKGVLLKYVIRREEMEDYSLLSDKEREALDFILKHKKEVAYMSMREVAGQSHVSTATINRMAHKLGYMNYVEFKRSLKQETVIDMSYDSLEIISCLNGLEEDYYEDKLYEMTSILYEADYILIYGIGYSGYVAEYAARRFIDAGKISWSTNDPFYYNHSLKGHRVNLFVSISGETIELVDILNVCKSEYPDSVSLCITANMNSTLVHMCDYAIAYPLKMNLRDLINKSSQIVNMAIIEKLAFHLHEMSQNVIK